MNKKYFVIIILLILFCNTAFTQYSKDTTQRNIFQTIGYDFKSAFNSGVKTFTSPLHYDSKDFIILGAVTLTTALAYSKDESFRAFGKKQHSEVNDKIMDGAKMYGELYSPAIIGGGLYGYGLFFKDEYVRETGRMVFEAVLFAGTISTVTKFVTGRYRPYNDMGKNYWTPFSADVGKTSFPSGHTTVAFAVSSVLANRIKNIYASIGLYTLASLTAISRVYSDNHWSSDVILASAIGYFVGDFVSKDRSKSKDKHSLKLYPGLGNFNLVYNF